MNAAPDVFEVKRCVEEQNATFLRKHKGQQDWTAIKPSRSFLLRLTQLYMFQSGVEQGTLEHHLQEKLKTILRK